ncbi:glycosylated lysosomal membrane protein B-like [Pieris brassicae]|uniref:Lysosomal protein NCU-G1 n=1 Tax=Pieris brassicae TaxID=7116 RepID=A0A9P0T8Q6_PIEBR|nr:glycosylated lysosomal membrane protein B-like [Pieris brassicae]XP_045512220.1 glycosylated lysosomal membrane protein B-like [Pieris brassicae]CAH4023227.1 unnamed protein product [Pieris brassicae]
MFPSLIRVISAMLFISVLFSPTNGLDRKISAHLNPGCQGCSSNTTTLVYIRGEGKSDVLHQIWDFTKHLPTVLLSVGSLNTSLNIQWIENKPIYFNWTEKPWYTFAATIDKLYEYDDIHDTGYINPQYPQMEYSLKRISWELQESILTNSEAMVHVTGKIHNRNNNDAVISIKLDLLPFKDYAVELPHLIHTANSTLIDVSLVNLTTSFNASRYALHFVLASTDNPTDTMHYIMRKSLDDEHTPGVFEIIEIKTPSLYDSKEGGYLQFRPVSYTSPKRNVASSTIAHVSQFNRTMMPRDSTLSLFFKESQQMILVQDMFVSFGESGDGYYKQHNYTAWAYTMGYGTPPEDGFSFFVILIISIGLGVPIVLALSGVAFVLFRRYRQTNTRTRFTNED